MIRSAGSKDGDFLSLSSRPVQFLLLAGAAERIAWNLPRKMMGAGGEAVDVAHAIGSGHGIADAFGPGTGATAHLMPVSPAIGGLVYAVFGGNSLVAEIVLATYSIALALIGYVVFDRVFTRLGAPWRARLLAFASLCLAPTYVQQEAVDFRVWEGGLAVLVLAILLDRVLASEHGQANLRRDIVTVLVAALLFVVHPLLGVAGAAVMGWQWLRHCPWRGILLRAGLFGTIVAVFLAGWTIRNERALGTPVLLRSNMGVELALGESPWALASGDGAARFLTRIREIHPRQSAQALRAMRAAGGEVAYAKALQAETSAWIRANPTEALEIAALHLGEIIAPPVWFFRVWAATPLSGLRSLLACFVGITGMIGIGLGLWRSPGQWFYVALAVLIPVLLFAPFQPVIRYTYLFYAIFTYSAFFALVLAAAAIRGAAKRDPVPEPAA